MAEKYLVRLGDKLKEIEVQEGPDGLRVGINGEWHAARLEQVGQSSLYALVIDERPYELFAEERAGGFDVVIGFGRYSIGVQPARGGRTLPPPLVGQQVAERQAEAGGWIVLSPMTGVVTELYASPGNEVQNGDVLLVIEAMKMNNELRAQRSGTVREVYVSKGQRVEQGTALLDLA